MCHEVEQTSNKGPKQVMLFEKSLILDHIIDHETSFSYIGITEQKSTFSILGSLAILCDYLGILPTSKCTIRSAFAIAFLSTQGNSQQEMSITIFLGSGATYRYDNLV